MELPGGKSLPIGGESSSSSRRDYEVFLSFKGLDTRLNITDSLYAAMIRAGICVFKSNKKLHVGEEIGGELLRVISNSKIYIPIFSKNYASNKWCLRELAYMVECRKRDKKVILPIFYGVDACDLKLKTGSYGKALRKHERQSSEDMTKQWEEALKEVAGIKGYNLKDYGQDKLIALVMEEVFSKLMPKQRNWCDSLVGIDHQMEAAMELLGLGTTDVRFVEMQFHHALQLFSKHSFESDSLPCDYMDISHKIVETTGGLPLALEVIGSLLHSKDKKTWKDTLKKLKKVPHQDVQRKLLISYKELEYEQKQIFLDIACHCIGEERIHAYYMWKACEFFPKSGLRDLIHLSLIKVTEDDRLQMHDQLRDLGRGIVQEECYLVPGKRSRLWCPTIALDVVQNNMGTYNIVALKLTRLGDEHNFTSGEFSRLPSLRFLELNGGNFIGDFKNLLSNLTWLSWRHCPSNLHATNLCLRKLAILKLSESNITKDWSGWGASMVNDNLKVIYLASCNYLKRIPDFSKCLKLKKLALKNCTRLEEIDSSINQLGRLKYLEIDGKVPLPWGNIFPAVHMLPKNSIGGLKSLLVLKMENHDGVRKLPPSIEELPGLKCLSLRGCCNLRELSNSIGELRSLLYLDLGNTGVSALPDSIGRLESLLELNVSYTPIAELPRSIGNLRQLQLMILSSSKIRELPKSIGTLENLLRLSANRCDNLEGEIPSEIAGLSRLEILELACTKVSRLPMTINRLFNLKRLDLGDCRGLQLLPNLPTSVERLDLSSPSLQVVPDLSNLNNLDYLAISDCNCSYEFSIIERGQIPHPNLEWLGRLHKLTRLFVDLFDFVMHPIDLSSLSQLRHFEITCADPGSLIRLPSSLVTLSLKDVKIPIEWSMFSNLENLIGLELFKCWFGEIVFDNVLGQLKKLHNLGVRECDALVRISNVSSLKEHQELWVESCPQLIEIEERPSIEDCSSMERPIPNIPKLEKLPLLTVEYCASLQKIPNACRLYVEGCPRLDGFND
ncbi:hypothetical protein EUGRSUZ_C03975 [Eucalyptus grandis]|uniref:Uncharacterized protein n=1 Tax=Eucalyptus grandis TaxID=71139 RepID=A0ACC3LJX9_EUCGR|nr:hypothetical protein EUGRSUZ_C03975 [Eucalyptus grandis]